MDKKRDHLWPPKGFQNDVAALVQLPCSLSLFHVHIWARSYDQGRAFLIHANASGSLSLSIVQSAQWAFQAAIFDTFTPARMDHVKSLSKCSLATAIAFQLLKGNYLHLTQLQKICSYGNLLSHQIAWLSDLVRSRHMYIYIPSFTTTIWHMKQGSILGRE